MVAPVGGFMFNPRARDAADVKGELDLIKRGDKTGIDTSGCFAALRSGDNLAFGASDQVKYLSLKAALNRAKRAASSFGGLVKSYCGLVTDFCLSFAARSC